MSSPVRIGPQSCRICASIPVRDFDVVFVSIDPNETWQLAAKKRDAYIRSYGRSKTGPGWHFLTGQKPQIDALADAVGFHFFYDPPSQQFAHPSGLMIVTPQGVLSKYFYGVEYDPTLLRQSILEAVWRHGRQPRAGAPTPVLSLEPAHGQVRAHHLAHHQDPVSGHGGSPGRIHVRLAAARRPPAASR